jgi:hypothetical protein
VHFFVQPSILTPCPSRLAALFPKKIQIAFGPVSPTPFTSWQPKKMKKKKTVKFREVLKLDDFVILFPHPPVQGF